MNGVPIVNVDTINNPFTKIVCAGLVMWGGAIILRKSFFSSPIEEHSRNKRYMIKSQSKLNKDIKHLNRNNIKVPQLPNYFGRHKRYNKFR